MNDSIEYLQVLVVQRRLCQQQINSPAMASMHMYKLKINQEKTVRMRHSIHHVPSCVNLQSRSFAFNVLFSCLGRFKAIKKSSHSMS